MRNTKDLTLLLQELSALTSKPRWDKRDEKRNAFLLSAVSVLKSDPNVTLQELEQDNFNEESRASGLPTVNFGSNFLSREQRQEAMGWKELIRCGTGGNREHRDMGEGAPMLNQLGTYTGLGYFVPTSFYSQVFAAMKQQDAIFNDDDVTVIRTANGRPLPVPVADDTSINATVVAEAGTQSSVDFNFTGHAILGAFAYKSPRFVVSLEAFEDLDTSLTTVALFRKFASERLARGIAADLVTGVGTTTPLGLLTQLMQQGAPSVIAAGSSANTGGSETGSNSLGTPDFASAFKTLDPAYMQSSKIAWMMNMSTLGTLMRVNDKYGRPIIDFVNGARQILGIPIKICPSLPNISSASTPVILGDWSYWATRLVVDDNAGIAVYKEAPGLIENGNIGLRAFMRADGQLLWKGNSNGPCPFVMIQNHS